MNNHHTAIIIGGGSAGCATAIQLKRSNIDFLLFEKDEIGGLARNANLIENYLGFPQGITGKRYIALLKKHLEHLEIVPEKNEIIQIQEETHGKTIALGQAMGNTEEMKKQDKGKIIKNVHHIGDEIWNV